MTPPDPQVQILLDQLAALESPDLSEVTVEEARQMMQVFASIGGEGPAVAEVRDLTIPGPAGEIPARLYRPEAGTPPVLVWFHGGGWVIGDLAAADPTCRDLAVRAGTAVVSVDYRLAPEHPFPAPVDDAYAAAAWVAGHAGELGVDATRLAVGGDSAGGNLAAVVSQLARQRGGPAIAFQLLVYPATDLRMGHPSIEENSEGYVLTRDSMVWFRAHYLGDVAKAEDPLASPLLAQDLAGLPPALVITAELDPLRDEGEAYGGRLEEAGVPVKVSRYDGQIHGFFGLGALLDGAKQAVEEAAQALRDALAP